MTIKNIKINFKAIKNKEKLTTKKTKKAKKSFAKKNILFKTDKLVSKPFSKKNLIKSSKKPFDLGNIPVTKKIKHVLPNWYSKDFDLTTIANNIEEILTGQNKDLQGKDLSDVQTLNFFDADHTILQTQTPVLLRHKESGSFLKHPDSARDDFILLKGRSYRSQYQELKKTYPNFSWDKYVFDYSEYGYINEVFDTPEISKTIDIMRENSQKKDSQDFIITARQEIAATLALDKYLKNLDVDIKGVFTVNSKEYSSKINFSDKDVQKHGYGPRKVLFMAGLIKLHEMKSAKIQAVNYYEDSNHCMQEAMSLLPKIFPHITFNFIDVVHVGNHEYLHKHVGTSLPDGTVKRNGYIMSEDKIRNYKSSHAVLHTNSLIGDYKSNFHVSDDPLEKSLQKHALDHLKYDKKNIGKAYQKARKNIFLHLSHGLKSTQSMNDLHTFFLLDTETHKMWSDLPLGEVIDVKWSKNSSKVGLNEYGKMVFEPPDNKKGDLSRAIFYVSTTYGLPISFDEEDVLRFWDREHPVSDEEKRHNDDVEDIQGNRNLYVDFPELIEKIKYSVE